VYHGDVDAHTVFDLALGYRLPWRPDLTIQLDVQNLFDTVFGGSGSKLAGQFLYATLITFVVIFAAIAVSRAAQRAKKDEEERRG
jgi:hypothetical protein